MRDDLPIGDVAYRRRCIELDTSRHRHDASPDRPDDRSGGRRGQTRRRARVRRPRPAARVPDARLRAAQAAQRRRSARSGPSPTARSTPASRRCSRAGWIAEDERRAPRAPLARQAVAQDRLPAHRRGQGALPGAARRERARPPGRTTASACTSPSSAAPTPTTRLRILEGRRVAARGAARRRSAPSLARTRERLDGYTLELQRHGLESVEREVRWLNELIDERARRTDRTTGTDHDTTSTTRTHRTDTRPSTDKEQRMGSVRVAIVGVGNCASSLVQGVEYYKDADPRGTRPRSDARAVRRLPRRATWSSSPRSTSTPRRSARTSPRRSSPARTTPSRSATCRRPASPCSAATPSTVSASTTARRSPSPTTSRSTSSQRCARPQVDVLVCYLPVGSEDAAKFYAQCAIDAEVALRQRAAGLHRRHPGVGRRSSPTPACRSSATTSSRRSAPPSRTACWRSCSRTAASILDRTYQLNVGGNMDFMNMLERDRLESKKISKTQAVTSQLQTTTSARATCTSARRTTCVARRPQVGLRPARGPRFGDVPLNLEYKLEVWDSPELGRRHHRRDPRARRSPWTAASAARSCRRRRTS